MSMRRSFSLIEVLIFVSILSVFLIGAAAIITTSMRQNTLKVSMLKATHYNQQLLEWIRSEKEINWNMFISRGTPTGAVYCFSSTSYTWSLASCNYDLEGVFKRYAIIQTGGAPITQVEVTVFTDWKEGGNAHSTKLHTVYTLWES